MKVGTGGGLARTAVAETISALWTFAHANGISLDDIIERSAAAGVTIDGVLLKDARVQLQDQSAAGRDVLWTGVTGDTDLRFIVDSDGMIEWGPGDAALDTMLQRDAAGELGTPDDFNVGGALDLGGDIELASRDVTFGGGNQHNVATGTVTVQRITPAAGGNNVTGFAGGRAGRRLLLINLSTTVNDDLDLQQEDALSLAANRIIVPNAVQVAVLPRGGIELWYDGTASRWRVLRPTT